MSQVASRREERRSCGQGGVRRLVERRRSVSVVIWARRPSESVRSLEAVLNWRFSRRVVRVVVDLWRALRRR